MAITKTALVTGFTGQDGTFLTALLLSKGYQVVGLCRRVSSEPPQRIRGDFDFTKFKASGQLKTVIGDLSSVRSLCSLISEFRPQEIYNLAAQSHVGHSFTQPEYTFEVNHGGLVNLITALDTLGHEPRLYQASTSEMFGNVTEPLMGGFGEDYPLNPTSPYAIAKAAAHFEMRAYRARGFHASSGILFNHESEIRGGDFVTQKIARAVAFDEPLVLGNLDSKRDWGYAGDYVQAMWLMLQQETPDEYVIGTGQVHSVREFVEAAFRAVGKELEWKGEGLDEQAFVKGDQSAHKAYRAAVTISPAFYRPTDVTYLLANADKAKRQLGWAPKVGFDDLVTLMVNHQVTLRREAHEK